MESSLTCPTCEREFVLPNRHMLNYDDFDYQPIPRFLPCLHTICHSCLEDQYQRAIKSVTGAKNEGHFRRVVCTVCKNGNVIKGVKYLPLDISTMKCIAESNSAELMSYCGRCYDVVKSCSWCETCSSALCEFHHQDHKLSFNTSKHIIQTFKEIAYYNHNAQSRGDPSPVHLEFKFPPVPCPEALVSDCSIYCHTCLHLISAQAMIDHHHQTHQLENCLECVDVMAESVRNSAKRIGRKGDELSACIAHFDSDLKALLHNEAKALKDITKSMNALREEIKDRERELKQKVQAAVEIRRHSLQKILDELGQLRDDCEHSAQVAENLLKHSITEGNGSFDSMYLVGAADSVDARVDDLCGNIDRMLKAVNKVGTNVQAIFSKDAEMDIIIAIKSLGGIATEDDEEEEEKKGDKSPALDSDPPPFNNRARRKIYFTLSVSDAAQPVQLQRFHNKVTVEVREKPARIDDTTSMLIDKGLLLGTVELNIELDGKLLRTHDLRSFFETSPERRDGLPKLILTKELVHRVG